VNAVTKDTGSEATHSLTLNTSKTPAPTPEPSKSAPSASDGADTGSSVKKYAVNAVLCVVALVVIFGGYKLLYRFASFKPVLIDKLRIVEKKDVTKDYKQCYYSNYDFFDCVSRECIDEIPVRIEIQLPNLPHLQDYYFYQPNPSKLKPLLRKMFGIETPVPLYPYFGALVALGE
jgi:hypothetical protein